MDNSGILEIWPKNLPTLQKYQTLWETFWPSVFLAEKIHCLQWGSKVCWYERGTGDLWRPMVKCSYASLHWWYYEQVKLSFACRTWGHSPFLEVMGTGTDHSKPETWNVVVEDFEWTNFHHSSVGMLKNLPTHPMIHCVEVLCCLRIQA